MNRATAALIPLILFALCSFTYALYVVTPTGTWPESWPKELESLRKQATTLEGPQTAHRTYQIPFTRREEFEAAWPHLLKIKSKGAPVFLVRSPFAYMGSIKAGVIVHCPPIGTDTNVTPEAPLPGQNDLRATWMNTSFIEVIVDGEVVDLNRIPLPDATPIVDERFKAQPKQAAGTGKPETRARTQEKPAAATARP
jgi:hypothetical protein